MRTTAKKVARDEDGKVLILALVLLVVGAFILAPLLGLMSTGLVAGQVYERKTAELYAADAGIEDALWKIKHDDVPGEPYPLAVNGKHVIVTIETTDGRQFLLELLDLKDKNWVHSHWVTFGNVPEPGTANITATWSGSGIGKLNTIGIWLNAKCDYVEGQGIGSDDVRARYPGWSFKQQPYDTGTAFIWEWADSDRPCTKDSPALSLTFNFTPTVSPDPVIAFTQMGRENVGLSHDGDFNLHRVVATAITDAGNGVADFGSRTTVVARATVSGCGGRELSVLSWNMAPDWDG